MGQHKPDPDFPEILRGNEESISESIAGLGEKYGLQYLKENIFTYAEKLEAISRLNRELSSRSPDGAEYGETVQNIMKATQDYYTYIGGLPEDIRQFFLLIANSAEGNDEPVEEISELVGAEVFFDTSPLLTAQAIRPKNYIMQIDAITNQLATLQDHTQLRVGKRAGQPVHTTVTLDMPDHMRIEGGGALSTYDKSIINGVTSLLESGNTVFSVPMLYHAMTGKQNPTVDDALYEEIAGKLEKMRRMMLSIDLTEENEARYFTDQNGDRKEITDLQLEGYLLPLNKVSGMINGKKTELFQVIQHPPLYTYSKMKRQLASVKISLLGAPVNNNSTTIPLKTYLLQRIEMMKNQKNSICQSSILYESIYQELGALEANKTKKMRIRSYTTTILDYFVEQTYIRSYDEYKKGRSIAGIQISL